MCPPSFITGLKPEMEIRDGCRFNISVTVKGDPDPQVTWTKDGKTLSSNAEMEVKYKNGVASFSISELYPEDAGRYICKATNTKGAVETSCKLKVLPIVKGPITNGSHALASPRIAKHIQSLVVKDSDPVRFEATMSAPGGSSKFDVVWLHDEKEIKPSKDFVYGNKGNTYTLDITEVFPEDAGTYTCEAFNDVGECFTTCYLVVQIKKQPATFVVEFESPPTTVSWTKDGKQLKEIPLKNRMTINKNVACLDIMECSNGDNGQYAIIATNKKGDTKAAFSLNVHT
ncbi:myosin light chain kinase, smooth muscle-like [Lepeophtheirus salmonis]|uniref:myosin light chain kinase, smooth muscle-like n=1 Tax=Lepeophtheirus salmonis TaxID=72036 RepID=UPI003AF40AC7